MTAGVTQVFVTEVGPRDGLQNESEVVPTESKVAFVQALLAAGHTDVEVGAFVRPDRVPAMADTAALFEALGPAPEGVVFGALVPNERGFEGARAAGAGKIAVFTAASETFNQRNVNASTAESIDRFRPVAEQTKAEGLALRGYVSTAIACPYEGWIAPEAVTDVAKRLLDLGCDELSIGDTIGAGTPAHVARLLDDLLKAVEAERVVLHLHDTRGMAVANVTAGLRYGVARYDASSGGLGGCPFAPGAAGNLATEDLIFLLDGQGIETGLDLDAQRRASSVIAPRIGRRLPSRVLHAPPLAP